MDSQNKRVFQSRLAVVVGLVALRKIIAGYMAFAHAAMLSANDLHNDGTSDYLAAYPNGDTQPLFIYP